MKLVDLKKILDEKETGIIKVKHSINGKYYFIDEVEFDVHGDLVVKVV